MQSETPPAIETVNSEPNVDQETYTLDKLPSSEPSNSEQWRQTGREFSQQFVLLLERAKEVFSKYKLAIIVIGLALAAMPFLALILALLAVINLIPLLAPTFELIGFGYTAWFVYRYLLFAPNRQEFSEEVEGLKQQIVGRQDTQMDLPQSVPAKSQPSPDTPEPTSFAEPDSELPKPNFEPS